MLGDWIEDGDDCIVILRVFHCVGVIYIPTQWIVL